MYFLLTTVRLGRSHVHYATCNRGLALSWHHWHDGDGTIGCRFFPINPYRHSPPVSISKPDVFPASFHSHRMYLSATFIISALSFFHEVTSTPRSGFAIPISKHTPACDADGVVDISSLERNVRHTIAFVLFSTIPVQKMIFIGWYVYRKIHHGFHLYYQNTATRHPFAPNPKRSQKRSSGSDPLVDWQSAYWYGTLSIGTPAKNFTGESSYDTAHFVSSGNSRMHSGHRHGEQRPVRP